MATQIKFMNERLQQESDKLWESGELSNEKLQEMQSEHLRTAYKECLRLDFLFMRNAQQVEHSAKKLLVKILLATLLDNNSLSIFANFHTSHIESLS